MQQQTHHNIPTQTTRENWDFREAKLELIQQKCSHPNSLIVSQNLNFQESSDKVFSLRTQREALFDHGLNILTKYSNLSIHQCTTSPDAILAGKGRAEHRLPASSWDFMAKLWKTIIHVSIVSSPQAVVRLGYLEMGISCEIRLSNYNNGYNGNVTAPHLPSLVITLYPLLLQNI